MLILIKQTFCHTRNMVIVSNFLDSVMVGIRDLGQNGETFLNKVLEYNPSQEEWLELKTSGYYAPLLGFYSHTAVYHEESKAFYIYGGVHYSTNARIEVSNKLYSLHYPLYSALYLIDHVFVATIDDTESLNEAMRLASSILVSVAPNAKLKELYGDKVRFAVYGRKRGLLQRFGSNIAQDAIAAVEERADYARFGL